MAKRLFDVLAAAAGLALLTPLLLAMALAVRLSSAGPVFFRQERVGRHGRRFKILKFRTMVLDAENRGLQISHSRDPRITQAGAFLRRYKLDELPQLINVLKGDMSLVGPRPEVPKYVALYTPEQKKVLEVRPGITDPASLAYRRESEMLASAEDLERYYIEKIMPDKLCINLEYLRHAGWWRDIGILAQTVVACFLK